MAETRPPTIRRLNRQAAAVLIGIGLILGVGLLAIRLVRPDQVRRDAAEQVERLIAAGRDELALRHLGQYLDRHPDDVPLLRIQARLLADRATAVPDLEYAARVHQRLLRLDPNGPDSDEVRRRLADLYIRFSDAYRASLAYLGAPDLAPFESRYRAAAVIAEQLIARDQSDRDAHRLRGMALEGLAVPGDEEALKGAIASYRTVLKLNPGDAVIAERLARLYRDKGGDPEQAEAVLDRLVETRPQDVEPRLVRYRYFREARHDRRADAELDQAIALAPHDPLVRLAAAERALQHGDTITARTHLEAISEDQEIDDDDDDDEVGRLRIHLMRGLIAFAEEHPQEAMEQWRQGLVLVRGTHAELTWWLAYVLVRMDRISEARPLVAQYGRLGGGEDDPAMMFLKALIDEQTGKPSRAIASLEKIQNDVTGQLREEAILALGRCYEQLGDEQEALHHYRLAAQIAPGSATPRLAMARVLMQVRPDSAAQELRTALAGIPDADAADLRLALAKVLLRQQAALPPHRRDWSAFDRALERAAEAAPESVDLDLMRAERLALEGRLDQADALLVAALDRMPRDPRLWVARAEVLARGGRPDEALALLDQAAQPEAAGDGAALRLTRARILLEQGHGREAQQWLARDLDHLPSDQQADLLGALGRLRASQGNAAGARLAFERWTKARPNDPEPVLALLRLALSGGEITMARQQLARLKALGDPSSESGEPDDLSYRIGEALLLLYEAGTIASTGNGQSPAILLNEAENVMNGVLRDAPELNEAYLIRGRILERRGRLDEAVADYRRAWEHGARAALPRLIVLLTQLQRFDEIERLRQSAPQEVPLGQISALALMGVGERDRASRLLDQLSDGQGSSNNWRIRMLELAGQFDQVEALLHDRAETAPTDDPTPWVALISAMVQHGRSAEQIDQVIQRAQQQTHSDRPELLKALYHRAARHWVAADQAFEASLTAHPDDPIVLMEAATYFEQTGRLDRAAEMLERALALDPENRPAARQLAVFLAAQGGVETWRRAWELVETEAETQTPEDRLARAIVLSRHPDPEQRPRAIEAMKTLLADLPPTHGLAAATRGYLTRLALAQNQPETALHYASASVDTADPEVIALHAEALIACDRLAEAETELDRLALLRPADPTEARLRARLIRDRDGPSALAQAVSDLGDSSRAEALGRAAFALLVDDGPASADAAERIGRHLAKRDPALSWMPAQVLARRGEVDEALSLCQTAIETGTGDHLNAACRVALEAMDATDQAPDTVGRVASLLQQAMQRAPDTPALLTMMAMIEHLQGHYVEEVRLYRRVLELWPAGRPETDAILNNLAWALSEGLGQTKEALAIVNELLQRHEADPTYLCTRGAILTRMNRFDEAIPDLERSVQADPSVRRLFHLARAYRGAGQTDRFRDSLARARDAGLSPEVVDRTEQDELDALLRF